MNDLETRLLALDLSIARSKSIRDKQESDLKKVKSYKGDGAAAEELLDKTKRSLKAAKTERKTIIEKLLKAENVAARKVTVRSGRGAEAATRRRS
jgi:hypothetical protein